MFKPVKGPVKIITLYISDFSSKNCSFQESARVQGYFPKLFSISVYSSPNDFVNTSFENISINSKFQSHNDSIRFVYFSYIHSSSIHPSCLFRLNFKTHNKIIYSHQFHGIDKSHTKSFDVQNNTLSISIPKNLKSHECACEYVLQSNQKQHSIHSYKKRLHTELSLKSFFIIVKPVQTRRPCLRIQWVLKSWISERSINHDE